MKTRQFKRTESCFPTVKNVWSRHLCMKYYIQVIFKENHEWWKTNLGWCIILQLNVFDHISYSENIFYPSFHMISWRKEREKKYAFLRSKTSKHNCNWSIVWQISSFLTRSPWTFYQLSKHQVWRRSTDHIKCVIFYLLRLKTKTKLEHLQVIRQSLPMNRNITV